ncbi:hypothetical protein BV898_14663 [Hypsibius exemplaris]|uniref:Uncharacterized protein n=1 Tax=Hypsibius exemplaris TaxID=2072580 RepID=A0A9X6RJP7_HYPEX|nr:hypothetical protein BV898_14663 [Hypsibius exemplaris]
MESSIILSLGLFVMSILSVVLSAEVNDTLHPSEQRIQGIIALMAKGSELSDIPAPKNENEKESHKAMNNVLRQWAGFIEAVKKPDADKPLPAKTRSVIGGPQLRAWDGGNNNYNNNEKKPEEIENDNKYYAAQGYYSRRKSAGTQKKRPAETTQRSIDTSAAAETVPAAAPAAPIVTTEATTTTAAPAVPAAAVEKPMF